MSFHGYRIKWKLKHKKITFKNLVDNFVREKIIFFIKWQAVCETQPTRHSYKKPEAAVQPEFSVLVKICRNIIVHSLSFHNSGCPDLLGYVLPPQETRWCWEGDSRKEMFHEEREKHTKSDIKYDGMLNKQKQKLKFQECY